MPRQIVVESDSNEDSDNDALSTLLCQLRSPKRLKEVRQYLPAFRLLKTRMQQALRKLEVQNNELCATNKRQQQQLADKENAEEDPNVAGRKKRRKTKSGSGGSNVAFVSEGMTFNKADEEELVVIASKFTYMSCFWLRQLDFTFKLEKDEDYDPATRFADTMSKCQGQLQDLLKVIPHEWHELMKNKSFFSLVCDFVLYNLIH
ncbi:MAG TPA: hypothetical protein VGO47_02235 [Chlamydiales bacterium]|nr:hypothetical protein [Chlamydiales bacterium]